MNKNSIIITVLVAVIIGGAAFFGGMKYQQAQSPSGQFAQAAIRFGGAGGRFGRGAGGMATIGQVVSSNNGTITVQMQDGSSKIVTISASTKIVKTNAASAGDLTKGTTVAVFGTPNSDGSVTAQNIQIDPMTMFRARAASASPTPMQPSSY